VLSQQYNIVAMGIFIVSRFISTFLMRYVRPGRLLMFFAMGGFVLVLGVIFFQNIYGLYCLVGVSAFMSLMFPTIYGIVLNACRKCIFHHSVNLFCSRCDLWIQDKKF